MKALLMHPDRDFDLRQPLPPQADAIAQDLELATVIRAMAGEDQLVGDVARAALLNGMRNGRRTILYRQQILNDALNHPAQVRELYAMACQAIEGKRQHHISVFRNYPAGTLYDALDAMHFFTAQLKRLRDLARDNAHRFESNALTNLFAMLQREFSDDYLATVQRHLKELNFRGGVLISAELGRGNEGANFVLRKPRGPARNWLERLTDRLLAREPPGYTYRLHERDEAGARILSEMRDRGIDLVANALAQSTEHILGFFDMLRTELAFYVGCLNLHQALSQRHGAISFPQPQPSGTRSHRFTELRDPSLALSTSANVIGNTIDADGKALAIITGANQGGKSTLLRAVGLAQLMMQCGMFVAAQEFSAEICTDLFTHYKREEDPTMRSGKLDEELARMSRIVDAIRPDSLILFNESFASTNEREGSEIARQIVHALLERRIKVWFVTHLYDFAHGLFDQQRPDSIFLRAQRLPDGSRPFKLVEAEPLETSFGQDLYRQVFEDTGPAAAEGTVMSGPD